MSTPEDRGQRPPEDDGEAAHIALGGLQAWRVGRARKIVERMDHKDNLYAGLGRLADNGGEDDEPIPRTLPERIMDIRIDRRSRKKIEAENNVYRARSVHSKTLYGPESSPPLASVRKTAIDRAASSALKSVGQPPIGVGKSIYENTKSILVGPDVPGYSSIWRRILRAGNRIDFFKGGKNARQARQTAAEIKAERMKLGSKMHRQTRRQERRRQESLELAASQPILSWWRNQRRQRAIRRITRLGHDQETPGSSN